MIVRKVIFLSILFLGVFSSRVNAYQLTRQEEIAREMALTVLQKSAWLKGFTARYRSYIATINKRIGTISINDANENKKIVLQIGRIPTDWSTYLIKKFHYLPRINERMDATKNALDTAANHSFPQMVDTMIQIFGERGVRRQGNKSHLTLTLTGRIIHADTKESVTGQFQYSYFETAKGTRMLFHRFFKPKKHYVMIKNSPHIVNHAPWIKEKRQSQFCQL